MQARMEILQKFKVESNEEFYMLVKILDANGYDIICCREKDKKKEG